MLENIWVAKQGNCVFLNRRSLGEVLRVPFYSFLVVVFSLCIGSSARPALDQTLGKKIPIPSCHHKKVKSPFLMRTYNLHSKQ